MFRSVSTIIRKIKLHKGEAKILKQFFDWKQQLENLPSSASFLKLLVIRIDDIGDYIVFRNFLEAYKTSSRWKNYEITLLGNIVWKDLFEMYDKFSVDKVIWLDKNAYFNDEIYRTSVWVNLRNQNFDVVICPSRTRRLLLDDLCASATGAQNKIGSVNTTFHETWNQHSDKIYTALFNIKNEDLHEFYFNKLFTEWTCKTFFEKVELSLPYVHEEKKSYVVCFISVSTKSRKWPKKKWIRFIQLALKKYNYKILVAGGAEDEIFASNICSATGAENITGKKTLPEIVNIIGNATFTISNDTMAVHIAAACNTKTIILSNGNNFYRFTEYAKAGFKNVRTLYSMSFAKALRNQKFPALKKYIAITKDISSIQPASVIKLMDKMI